MNGEAADGSRCFGASGGVEREADDIAAFYGGAQVESVGVIEDTSGVGFCDDGEAVTDVADVGDGF